MKRIYAISDIHGCLDKFNEILELINFNIKDRLIILGDCIDRGSNNLGVIFRIMQLQEDGYDIIVIKGNHEGMFLDAVQKYGNQDDMDLDFSVDILKHNGTYGTMCEFFKLDGNKMIWLVNTIRNFKSYHIEDNYLFVHAEVSPQVKLEDQQEDALLWIRDEFVHSGRHGLDYTVIFGHTPTRYLDVKGEDKIWHHNDKIGIDCGCVYGGKLACLEVNRMKEYYV